jgi:Flp pilus assembly protein TadD
MTHIQHCAAPTLSSVRESVYASAFTALGLGNTADAQRYFGLMLAVAPFDYRAWLGLAAACEQTGDCRLAANFYGVASDFEPRSAYCKLGQARALLKLGESANAATLFDEAERLSEDPSLLAAVRQLRGEL